MKKIQLLKFSKEKKQANPNSRDEQQPVQAEAEDSPGKPKPRWLKGIGIALAAIFLIGGLATSVAALQARSVAAAAKKTVQAARAAYDAGKNQDLIAANQQLEDVKANLDETQRRFQTLSWTKWIPIAGSYWRDGDHALNAAKASLEAADVLVDAIEPYADVLGFKGQGSFLGGTAEDRIVKALETLDKVTPQLDIVAEKLEIVNQELGQIDPKRYRFTYQGTKVDDTIRLAQNLAQDTLFAVTKAKPAIEKLPKIMGVEGERKYMVLFQNDAELRATGGFMTAFAILRIEKGKVFQEKSEDIYALDSKFNSRIPAPEIIRKYLPLVYRYNLRDMNLSPDFKVSMDEFSGYYNELPGEPEIDGIIAVDTQVLKDIVEVLGPIEVPGYGTFTAENDPRCECPQIVYELELLVSRPVATLRKDRKGVLGPMLQTILMKSYAAPKQIWPNLFQAIIRNVDEKHVLFYFYDSEEQRAMELLNIAGRIEEYEGDYFHLNDTNFAGAKSNMFTDHQVEQIIEVADDGTITKTVTIKYQNPHPPSNCNLEAGELCLNGTLRDFVRLYVPKGSTLIEALGSEEEVETKEDLGKTVFEGFFTLRPQSQAKLIFRYTLPFKASQDYNLLIQKQPGKRAPTYTIITPSSKEDFTLKTDKQLSLPL
ncbi:DUF4012 domain-containing protein [Patescibacteria group bacterium]|nr:DUF4012 domain-containing protein [Patescibacteria group bacterium]